MSSFKKYLEAKDLSKSTITHYNTHALDFISWLDGETAEPENATAGDIMAYLNHLKKKGQGNQTRRFHLNTLKHYFDWHIQYEKRTDNPAQHIKIRGIKQQALYPIYSQQELESLYNNYQLPQENDPRQNRNWWNKYKLSRRRNKAALSLLVHQGLTTSEIDHLTPKDLKLREGKIYIKGSRKSNERELELKPHQIMELMEYNLQTRGELINLTGKQTDQLFVSIGHNTQSNNNWKRLTHILREQNPKHINCKQIRASVITDWLGKYNLRQVQYMAGHRYVSSTEAYLVNKLEDLQSDIDQYHPLDDEVPLGGTK